MLDYRDLAALPRDKAIYNIDRPDMISYSPYISRVAADRQSYGEVGPAGGLGQPAGRAVTPQRGSRPGLPHRSLAALGPHSPWVASLKDSPGALPRCPSPGR